MATARATWEMMRPTILRAALIQNVTERFQYLSFYGRRKDPHIGEFLEIKPSNLTFDRVINYCFDRFYDKTITLNDEDANKLWEQ